MMIIIIILSMSSFLLSLLSLLYYLFYLLFFLRIMNVISLLSLEVDCVFFVADDIQAVAYGETAKKLSNELRSGLVRNIVNNEK